MLRRWAGFEGPYPLVMGILNVTPDSFSDGGVNDRRPVEAGLAMAASGADIVDVGGESTRPGAPVVDVATEIARVVPVVRALAASGIAVSIDTRNAATMQAALEAGARIINDVSALAHDPASAGVVARAGCPVVLMHMRGDPATMTTLAEYHDVGVDVARELAMRLDAAERAGVARSAIALDPGIGFAKRPADSVRLLQNLAPLRALGLPLLVGVSRKGVIGRLSGEADAALRGPGSIAAGLFAVQQGASILRVHDVAATVQAVRVWRGLAGIR
jgi:dihydropteroate synthase